jgi:cytochrome c oxidase subunit 2
MRSKFELRKFLLLLTVSLLPSCGGNRSALNPAGEAAEKIAVLFWWMTAGGTLVWIAVMAIAVYVVRARNDNDREPQAKWLIFAGAAVPAVVLAVLLAVGLRQLPALIAPAPEGTLRIAVQGEQWWWRFRYEPPNGLPFEVANEIRIPVGKPVEFHLESDNVIHSFWIPSLGGKMDLIPGRVNRLVLRPTRTGTFRGMCAEFCGTAHAKMAFATVVVTQAEFDQWLVEQSREAQP